MLAIVNGRLFTISHGVVEAGTILIDGGRLVAVGASLGVPAEAHVIDAGGGWVYPGLIDARTSVGLFGDGGGSQNADNEETTEPDTAWVRAIDAINPADPAFADAREAGVTTVLAGPGTSNVAGGLSAVVKTAGGTLRDMLVREPAGLQISLGRPPLGVYRDKNKVWTRMGMVGLLRERLTAARALMAKKERTDRLDGQNHLSYERNFRLEPYVGLLRGEYPARMRVAAAEDAWTALRLADEFGFDLVLEQLTEGHLAGLPEELARRGVRCVVGPMMKAGKTPETRALSFQTAVVLAQAGVPFALCTGHPSRPVWSLRLEAALAVRAGLGEATALRAITLNAAAALGLEDRRGSLEAGKDADVAIFDGDPLLATSCVTHTLIAGHVVYIHHRDTEDTEKKTKKNRKIEK